MEPRPPLLPSLSSLSSPLSPFRLESASLLALAPLHSLARWTTITGSASLLDILFLAPGIHKQQSAPALSNAEYPPTAALTSGYVFRIENEATVRCLQSLGVAGCLVNVAVDPQPPHQWGNVTARLKSPGWASVALYGLGPVLTVLAVVLDYSIGDWWALGVLGMLMVARGCNVVVIKRRSRIGWKGAAEPGVRGDLLVLLSRDRWIRMRGLVDDLKAVASGQWLRDTNGVEEVAVSVATMVVYLAAAMGNNASSEGNLILLVLLFVSAVLLEMVNGLAEGSVMYGRVVRREGQPILYKRRLDLVNQLIEESGRDDWAVGLGMISKSSEDGGKRAVL